MYKTLKVLGILILLYILYFQIIEAKGWVYLQKEFSDSHIIIQYKYIFFAVILMPINWLLEAKKWQILYRNFEKINLKEAFITVLAGNSLGVVTPARIGEYGGRLITSHPDHRGGVILATFIGSITQNVWNLFIGLSFSFFLIQDLIGINYIEQKGFLIIGILQTLMMTALLIFLPKILFSIAKTQLFKKSFLGLNTHDLVSFSSRSIYKSIGWSLVRYIIYTIQYALVIMAFNGWSGIETLFSGIALIYFVQTIIPLPSLVNVVARGEIAIFIWPKLGLSVPVALLSSYTIWLINLIFPALIGAIFLYSYSTFSKSKSTLE